MGNTRPPKTIQESPRGSRASELAGSPLDKKFGLGEVLTEDSTGTLFATSKLLEGNKIAVQVLNPTASIRSMDVVKIKHPNICETMRILKLPDGSLAIVLQSPMGKSLTDLTASGATFTPSQAVSAALQLLSAIHAIHEQGETAFHLNANNIFLHRDDNNNLRLNLVNCGVGTLGLSLSAPHFLSPERLMNEDEGDKRADIWASGAILYHLLQGHPLFEGKDSKEIAAKNMLKDPVLDASAGIPEELVPILKRALDRDPENRYASATDMVADLLPLRKKFHEPMSEDVNDALRNSAPPGSPAPAAGSAAKPVKTTTENGVPLAKPASPERRPRPQKNPARTLMGMPAMDLSALSAKIMKERAEKAEKETRPTPEEKPEPKKKPEPEKKSAPEKPAPKKKLAPEKPAPGKKPVKEAKPASPEPDPMEEVEIPTEILDADRLSYLMNRINDLADEEEAEEKAGGASEQEDWKELSKRPTVAPAGTDESKEEKKDVDFESKTRPSSETEQLSQVRQSARETKRDILTNLRAKKEAIAAEAERDGNPPSKSAAIDEKSKKPGAKEKKPSPLSKFRKKDDKPAKEKETKKRPSLFPRRKKDDDKPEKKTRKRSSLFPRRKKDDKPAKEKETKKRPSLFPRRKKDNKPEKEKESLVATKMGKKSAAVAAAAVKAKKPLSSAGAQKKEPRGSAAKEKAHPRTPSPPEEKSAGKPPFVKAPAAADPKPEMDKSPAGNEAEKPAGLGTAGKPKSKASRRSHTLEMRIPQIPALHKEQEGKKKRQFAATLVAMPAVSPPSEGPAGSVEAPMEDEELTSPPPVPEKESTTTQELDLEAIEEIEVAPGSDDGKGEPPAKEPAAQPPAKSPKRPLPLPRKKMIAAIGAPLVVGLVAVGIWALTGESSSAIPGDDPPNVLKKNIQIQGPGAPANAKTPEKAAVVTGPATPPPEAAVPKKDEEKTGPEAAKKADESPTPVEETPPEAEEKAPAAPAEVTITLTDLLDDAEVKVDGTPAASPIKTPEGKKGIVVTVERKGYRKWRRTVIPDRDRTLPVRMDKEKKSPQKASGGASASKAPSQKKKKSKKLVSNPFF